MSRQHHDKQHSRTHTHTRTPKQHQQQCNIEKINYLNSWYYSMWIIFSHFPLTRGLIALFDSFSFPTISLPPFQTLSSCLIRIVRSSVLTYTSHWHTRKHTLFFLPLYTIKFASYIAWTNIQFCHKFCFSSPAKTFCTRFDFIFIRIESFRSVLKCSPNIRCLLLLCWCLDIVVLLLFYILCRFVSSFIFWFHLISCHINMCAMGSLENKTFGISVGLLYAIEIFASCHILWMKVWALWSAPILGVNGRKQ